MLGAEAAPELQRAGPAHGSSRYVTAEPVPEPKLIHWGSWGAHAPLAVLGHLPPEGDGQKEYESKSRRGSLQWGGADIGGPKEAWPRIRTMRHLTQIRFLTLVPMHLGPDKRMHTRA